MFFDEFLQTVKDGGLKQEAFQSLIDGLCSELDIEDGAIWVVTTDKLTNVAAHGSISEKTELTSSYSSSVILELLVAFPTGSEKEFLVDPPQASSLHLLLGERAEPEQQSLFQLLRSQGGCFGVLALRRSRSAEWREDERNVLSRTVALLSVLVHARITIEQLLAATAETPTAQ